MDVSFIAIHLLMCSSHFNFVVGASLRVFIYRIVLPLVHNNNWEASALSIAIPPFVGRFCWNDETKKYVENDRNTQS